MALAEALGLAGKVKFLSVNMREELLRYYDACDVFLMPSRQLKDGEVEGFGIVYIEANARRKPVIAGNSGGTVEAVIDGETGLIVNGEDLHQIAQAIIRLLTDRELGRRMGEAGRRRAETEFRLQPEVDKISSYLKRVALGHKMKKVLGKRRFLFLKHDVDQNPVYYR
jgi:phosphatidylinositol alpha-1,6-mannosyltransferase